MISVNLLPPERRELLSLPNSIDAHPFFSSLLGISGPGGNPIVGQVAQSNVAEQAWFLTIAGKARS